MFFFQVVIGLKSREMRKIDKGQRFVGVVCYFRVSKRLKCKELLGFIEYDFYEQVIFFFYVEMYFEMVRVVGGCDSFNQDF